MSDDLKKWLNPWPLFPQRSGEAVGKSRERTMFGVVGSDAWAPRTVIRDTPDGTVMMKTGGGLVSFKITPNGVQVYEKSNGIFPLTERDYNERTYYASRATLYGSLTPCIPYQPLEYMLMLDINGYEVEFNFLEPPP